MFLFQTGQKKLQLLDNLTLQNLGIFIKLLFGKRTIHLLRDFTEAYTLEILIMKKKFGKVQKKSKVGKYIKV